MPTSASGDEVGLTSPPRPWLGQGDVFRTAPIVEFDPSGELRLIEGPAVLLTHDCVLDKRGRTDPRPAVPRLHFARVSSAETLDRSRRETLISQAWRLDPSEVFYLGRLPGIDDAAYIELSDVYSV